jgi:hypothetical protein
MWLMKLLASRRSSTANIDVTDPDSYCNGSVAETGVFFGIIIKEKQNEKFRQILQARNVVNDSTAGDMWWQ